MTRRRSGVLLHPTSLPGEGERGVLGENAFFFIDFLHSSGQTVWQVLPLGPTHADRSPYQCLSVNAGDPALICWQKLVDAHWLATSELQPQNPDHEKNQAAGLHMAAAALRGFHAKADEASKADYAAFKKRHVWLADFALYCALRDHHAQQAWYDWPVELRDRDPAALKKIRHQLAGEIEVYSFQQFIFFRQWQAIKRYANERGVSLFGDLPIFVAHDSAEVWAHRECFALDENGHCNVVAGVPPDYFSQTGQRWGNPHYNWQHLANTHYRWWTQRIQTQLELFDLFRIDHFRGFEAYWEIPASATTAVDGRWVQGPGAAFFAALNKQLGALPLIAEDLGVITDAVIALRDQFNFPGMKILQFAFDGNPQNPYLPHNHVPNSVVYTGTHDNNTSLGWHAQLPPHDRERLRHYFGDSTEAMPWLLIRAALASVADLAIIPLQDILELDETARMNVPGTCDNNWRWRFQWPQLTDRQAATLREMTRLYGR